MQEKTEEKGVLQYMEKQEMNFDIKKEKRKNILCTSSVILVIIIVTGLILWRLDIVKPSDENRAEEYLKRNKNQIILITEYFIDSDIQTIYIQNLSDIPLENERKVEDKIEDKTSYQKSIGKRKIFFITLKKEKTYLQTGVKGKMNALQRALDTVLKI